MDEAVRRRLRQETGLSSELEFLYKFQYQAAYEASGSEHEMCWVYAGVTDDEARPNPTEIAVALEYDQEVMEAPRVLAKGKDRMAERIRNVAKENGVPIVEKKPLAQALHKMCEVGDYIPPELYQAVAEVLAYVYELSGMRRRAG